MQQTCLSESSKNGKKKKKKREREKLLFSLLDNPTLDLNFKWQPLKVASLVLIWKWKL